MNATIEAGTAATTAMDNNSLMVGSSNSCVPAFGKNQQTKRTKYEMKNANKMSSILTSRKKGDNDVLIILLQ